ncbi:MAG: PadR family transcriptional regulator [Candidatus Micrarchaeia archaeon]|jgi:DNA-binding PadR family transcriptional regulator
MSAELNIGVLELQVLWLLGKEPQHGYALMARLSEFKRTSVKQGTLYPTMGRLVRKKLVSRKREENRVVYSLTPLGRKVLKVNASELVRMLSGIIGDYYCPSCSGCRK